MASPRSQKPLELILARNLLTSISTPAFLLDDEAAVVFYNEAAAALLGRTVRGVRPDGGRAMDARLRAASTAAARRSRWTRSPTTDAIRSGRPAHAEFTIRSADGESTAIEASAFPIVASEEGSSGAMVLFWPVPEATAPR